MFQAGVDPIENVDGRGSARTRSSAFSPGETSKKTGGGFIGTMSRSDFRPQLSPSLWSSLAMCPHREPFRWTRSGLLGSENDLSYVMRRTTPVARLRLAYRRCTCWLHGWEPARPPRHSIFRSLPRTPYDSCLRFGPCVTEVVPVSRTIDPLLAYRIGKTVVGVWQKPRD